LITQIIFGEALYNAYLKFTGIRLWLHCQIFMYINREQLALM
jgi:hypothetical protein